MKKSIFSYISFKQVLSVLLLIFALGLNAQTFHEIKFAVVSTGTDHTLSIDINGRLWGWGLNTNGQVGDMSDSFFGTPVQVAPTIKFIAVSAGYKHSLAIDEYGKLYQWGYCYVGNPGSENWEIVNEPTILIPDKIFTKISAGLYFNLAIDGNGFLYAWGDNTYGQTGLGSGVTANTAPVKVFDSRSFVEISAGGYHSLLIDDAGRLWGMGRNDDGQLGNASNSDVFNPILISSTFTYTKIAAGLNHSLILNSYGAIYTCGSNQYGQMGVASVTTSNEFFPLAPVGASVQFSNIFAGWNNSFAVSTNNETFAWGVNSYGQLGCDNEANQPLPIQIMVGNKGNLVNSKSYHTLAIDSYGYLWGWGYNDHGQLGDPSIEYTLIPRVINGPLSKVVSATAGNLSTLLNDVEKQTVKILTISGTIDARDFAFMRDSMKVITVLDIHATSISFYLGEGGTAFGNYLYPENEVPLYSFYNSDTRVSKPSIEEVVFPSSIKTIEQSAFYYCAGLKKITFSTPSALTKIDSYAFGGCSRLEGVELPSSVNYLADGAFYYTNHSVFNVSAFVTFIGNQALALVKNQINVDAANPNYKSIDGVLYSKDQKKLLQCPNEKEGAYTMPSTVESVERAAFIFCRFLTGITNSPKLQNIEDYAFYNCQFLASYEIPSGVTSIKPNTFMGCNSLSSISIPQTITSIGNHAFYGCAKLPEITIPASVASIAYLAFAYCNALSKIYALSATPVDLSNSGSVFLNVNKSSCVLYVPHDKKLSYQSAVEWQDFQFIEEMKPTSLLKNVDAYLNVTVQDNIIYINDIGIGERVSVYNIQGVTICNQKARSITTEIPIKSSGVYLVQVGYRSAKVFVK